MLKGHATLTQVNFVCALESELEKEEDNEDIAVKRCQKLKLIQSAVAKKQITMDDFLKPPWAISCRCVSMHFDADVQ